MAMPHTYGFLRVCEMCWKSYLATGRLVRSAARVKVVDIFTGFLNPKKTLEGLRRCNVERSRDFEVEVLHV